MLHGEGEGEFDLVSFLIEFLILKDISFKTALAESSLCDIKTCQGKVTHEGCFKKYQ